MELKRIFSITKFLCKSYFDDIFCLKINDKFKKAIVFFYMIFLVMVISTLLVVMVSRTYPMFLLKNEETIILEYIFSIVSFIVFVFVTIAMITVMLFSKDVEAILPLPISINNIILCKLLVCMIYSYIFSIILIAPLFIYGILNGQGFLNFIIIILVTALFPIMPVCIIGILLIFISNIRSAIKYRLIIKRAFSIIAAFLIIAVQPIITIQVGNRLESEQFYIYKSEFINIINNIIVSNRMLIEFIKSEGTMKLLYFLLAVLISMLSIFLFFKVGEKFYIKGILDDKVNFEDSSKEKCLNINKNIKKKPILINLIINEFRLIMRSSSYFFSYIAVSIIMPIAGYIGFSQSVKLDNLALEFFYNINSDKHEVIFIIIMLFINAICISINPISYSSISREGRGIYYNMTLPVDFKSKVLSKYIVAVMVNTITVIINLTIYMSISNLSLICIVNTIILNILIASLVSGTNILIDVKSPNLQWESESTMLRGNINIYKGILIAIFIFIISLLLGILFESNMIIYSILSISILIISNLILVKKMLNTSYRNLNR